MEDIGKEDLYVYSNRIRYKESQKPWDFVKFMNNEYFHPNGTDYDPYNITYVEKASIKLKEDNKNITELDKYRQVSIEDMVRLMEEEAQAGTKVFIIDHLHYFKKTSQTRTDLEIEEIMHDINEIARKYNVAVFLLAHYRKLNNAEPSNDAFKDGAAIKQVANIIIHLSRED
jgi:replicative DNA helicase